jgi:hypothetical protein
MTGGVIETICWERVWNTFGVILRNNLSLNITYPQHSPSSPPLHPITMDKNRNPMALDADEHITRLESGLSEVREQARVQQNTLDDILQILQRLLIVELEKPRNLNQIPGAPATTPKRSCPSRLSETVSLQVSNNTEPGRRYQKFGVVAKVGVPKW